MCTEHGFHLLQDCRPATSSAAGEGQVPNGSAMTRRAALAAAGAAVATVGLSGTAQAAPATSMVQAPARRWRRHGLMDLTHPLSPTTPAFTPGEEAVRSTVATLAKDGYYMQEWKIIEHIGTHVDAPAHFAAGRRTADQLTPAELITPAVVVDISAKATKDPDALVTVDDLRAFEKRHGRIPEGCAVLMYSGWGAKVGNAAAYRGADAKGVLHFPGFAPEAAGWLVKRRRIRSVGVDTLSIDHGPSQSFDTHVIVNSAERYGVENLANLHRIPPTGARIMVGLIPFYQGSGGQARIFALW